MHSGRNAKWSRAVFVISAALVLNACGSGASESVLNESDGPTEIDVASDAPAGAIAESVTSTSSSQGTVQGTAVTTMVSPVSGDFADGEAGGPDYWKVAGVASNDALNIRANPDASAALVGSIANGAIVRNLGCRNSGAARWCRISLPTSVEVDGWVNGRFLRESGPPVPGSRPPSRPEGAQQLPADVPELVARSAGNFELRYSGGCTILTNSGGSILQAGSSCSAAQRQRATKATVAYVKEQGL